MTKASELLEGMKNTRKRSLTQYANQGNSFSPIGSTEKVLEAGIYEIKPTMNGTIAFEQVEFKTDDLLRFEDPTQEKVLNDISDFWEKKDKFGNLGFSHKRGILMFGPPGSGKSCVTKLVVEDVVNNDNIVFLCKDIQWTRKGLKEFREVEPDRQCLVLMEDVDDLVRMGSNSFLELLSGDSQVDNVLYLGTTNYIERLPERAIRPDRFDRKIEVPHPPEAGRRAYLQNKTKLLENESFDVEYVVEKTDGFSFAHLKELLISHFCHGYGLDETIERLKGTGIEMCKTSKGMSESYLNERLKKSRGKAVNILEGIKDDNGE